MDILDPVFKDHDMSLDDFKSMTVDFFSPRDWVLTLIANSQDGTHPVGCISAMNPLGTRLVTIADIIWFPWASPRNRLESVVNFVNELRDDSTILEFADERPAKDAPDGFNTKLFFETVCKYGAMRRVGTVHDFYGPGNSAALFQSRRRKN